MQSVEPRGQTPDVHAVKPEDLPQGNAAAVSSPVFRHRVLPDVLPPPVSPHPVAAPDVSSPLDVDPDIPPVAAPAAKQDLSHMSREEIRVMRKEERRVQRVIEGRAPAEPGDPVPHAPLTLAQQKEAKSKGKIKKTKDLSDVHIAPVAQPAQMQKRHWGAIMSVVVMVLLPLIVVGWYLNQRAVDQYASTVGFTVRSEEGGSSALTGLLSSFGGGGTQTDTDILHEFIQGQSLVNTIQEQFDLRAHYSQPHDKDPVFALDPDATAEDLHAYWSNIVTVSYDQTSKLIEMRVQAFEPKIAQQIAEAVLQESQTLINALNEQARNDTLRYSEQDLETAQSRLRQSREALILFRTRTQIVDPETDLQGRLGVVNSLQQLLAAKLIEQDQIRGKSTSTDPRDAGLTRDIDAIRSRIAQEREAVVSGDASAVDGAAYPQLLAEYEGLQADRLFAEEAYRAALISNDASKANASRQSRYLAVYIDPTLPQTAEYPRRWMIFGLAGLFLVLAWSVVILIYYSIRDSK